MSAQAVDTGLVDGKTSKAGRLVMRVVWLATAVAEAVSVVVYRNSTSSQVPILWAALIVYAGITIFFVSLADRLVRWIVGTRRRDAETPA